MRTSPNIDQSSSRPMRSYRITLFWLLIVGFLPTPIVLAQPKDRVFLSKGGASATGKVTERTKDKVVFETTSGKVQNYSTNDIVRIIFEGEPQQLSRAKDNIIQGQLAQAKKEISEVAIPADASDEIKEEYLFYRSYLEGALALTGQGNPQTASETLTNWAKKYQSSHNFYKASEMLGDLAVANGNPDLAAKFYTVLTKTPFPDLALKGNYLLGKALMISGKYKESIEKLNAVAQEKTADPSLLKLQKLAKVLAIRGEAASGKANEAIAKLEKMVDEGDATDGILFGEIFNALGMIFQSQNNDYEALLSFLKTDKLYSSQPDQHAEALYNLSKLWEKTGDTLRATDAKSRLAKQYPTSPWVKK